MCVCEYFDVAWTHRLMRHSVASPSPRHDGSPLPSLSTHWPSTAWSDLPGYKEMLRKKKREVRRCHRGCDEQFSSSNSSELTNSYSSQFLLTDSSPTAPLLLSNMPDVCKVCDGRTCYNQCCSIEQTNTDVSKNNTVYESNRTTTTTTTSSTSWNWNSRLFCLPSWIYLVLLLTSLLRIAESCSSRSTPKPQQPSPTTRPNMTFLTYACPPDYAAWYCLNGATCFTVTIGESILYNCECADGYMGQRCEYKDLDQSYLPSRGQVMVETASIAGGVTVAVLLIVIVSISISVYCRRRAKIKPILMSGIKEEDLELKPFRSRVSFSSSIRMSTTMYSSSNEPESGHKVLSNSKIEHSNSTSA